MNHLLAGFLALFLVGCAVGEGPVLRPDADFSPREVELLRSAFDEVCFAADSQSACATLGEPWRGGDPIGEDFMDLDYQGEVAVVWRLHSAGGVYAEIAAHKGSDFGAATDHSSIVLFPDLYENESKFRETVMHELGHVFGAEHGDGPLMNPGYNGDCIDAGTLEAICDEVGCGLAPAPTCGGGYSDAVTEGMVRP